MTIIVYDNQDGETFYRVDDTYGHTGEYDVRRETKAAMDKWLSDKGFRVVGYEKD